MKNGKMILEGNIVDVLNDDIFLGEILVEDGCIKNITRKENDTERYILPGFIDSHIHIESSMLTPSEFARKAVQHGTISTVSDPHEIANVLGSDGVRYMIENGRKVPFKFYFGAPSCVPATSFESSGAEIDAEKIEELFAAEDCRYLGEMMNYPGVVRREEGVMQKIETAKEYGAEIDGHAPGLTGKKLRRYISAGISTDHESLSREEAEEKIKNGMKIQIREGSSAKDFSFLIGLIEEYPDMCMFCSDDRHVDDLVKGHIDTMVRKAVEGGFDVLKVLKAACVNPVLHYGLDVGLLQEGDPADFIVVDDLNKLNVKSTFIDGKEVHRNGKNAGACFKRIKPEVVNNFKAENMMVDDFYVESRGDKIRVISAKDRSLQTEELIEKTKIDGGNAVSDIDRDILKFAVLNRYEESNPSVGFVHNFGLEEGAIASSVSHDSHNIAAVGVDDGSLCRAVNLIIENKGGLSAVSADDEFVLPLPIAGLMSNRSYEEVNERYCELKKSIGDLGCTLSAPFMTLSFLSLLVIPKLKLSDKGLFDVEKFEFVDLFCS